MNCNGVLTMLAEFSVKDGITIMISLISLTVSVSLAIYNVLKAKRVERKEEFSKVFKKYNKRYQEYYEKMRDKYDLKQKNDYLLMIDSPKEFYPLNCIKVKIEDIDPVKKRIVYNKNKFPYKNEDFLSNYLSSYYDGKLRNEPSFFLTGINNEGENTEFSFVMNGYNEYINSGTYLEYEIANSHGNPKNRIDLLNYKNRYVGVGICTITIIKNVLNEETGKKISYFLMHERNPLLTEHPGQKSVVPAGTFEPINKSDIKAIENYNIENTVYREFGEELLGIDEFTSLANVESLDEGVMGQIKKASKTKYLGSGLDVMNGKLELMGMLIIDPEKMGKDYKNITIEDFFSKIKLAPNSEGVIFSKKLTKAHLNHYANNVMCAPIARQLCKILVSKYEENNLFK